MPAVSKGAICCYIGCYSLICYGALDTATPGPSGSKLVLACALASMTSRSDTRVLALTGTLTADALTCASAFARIFSLRTASLRT